MQVAFVDSHCARKLRRDEKELKRVRSWLAEEENAELRQKIASLVAASCLLARSKDHQDPENPELSKKDLTAAPFNPDGDTKGVRDQGHIGEAMCLSRVEKTFAFPPGCGGRRRHTYLPELSLLVSQAVKAEELSRKAESRSGLCWTLGPAAQQLVAAGQALQVLARCSEPCDRWSLAFLATCGARGKSR